MDIIDRLDQDRVWTSQDGRELYLTEMSPQHRLNLLRWLERNAVGLNRGYFVRYFTSGLQPSGDAACDAFDAACDEFIDTPPLKWLHETPLVRRLTALVAKDVWDAR